MSQERDELVSIVKHLLAKRADSAAVRAAFESPDRFDRDLWQMLCEQVGVAALMVPEEYDGAGATLSETAAVLEQLASSLAPTPLLATSIATCAVMLGGTDSARSEFLPRLAGGEIGTIAWSEGAGDLVLDGTKADLIFSLSDGVLSAHESASTIAVAALDPTIRLARVSLGEGREIGHLNGDVLREFAWALASAEQVGIARRGLEMTNGYLKERVQFGRPIGSFQALKHRMADLLVLTEMMRSACLGATDAAAAALTDPSEENRLTLAIRAAVAKSYCSDSLDKIAAEVIQLHGGIAITWEHDGQLVFKRAMALSALFGPAHRARAALV